MAESKHSVLRHYAARIILAYLRLMERSPLGFARLNGIVLGRVAYYLSPKLRRVGMENLRRVYGVRLPEQELRQILRKSLESCGIVLLEFSKTSKLCTEKYAGQVEVNGLELVDPSRGGLVVGGHLANWEWMGPALAQRGISSSVIVNRYSNEKVDTYINDVRQSGGVSTIPRSGSARGIIQRISDGEFVGMLIDQRPHQHSIPVDFLGTECRASAGAALIALSSGAPIHTVNMRRQRGGKYLLSISAAIGFERSGDIRRDTETLTQILQDKIAEMIRESPEQWLWAYNRWKKPRSQRATSKSPSEAAEVELPPSLPQQHSL